MRLLVGQGICVGKTERQTVRRVYRREHRMPRTLSSFAQMIKQGAVAEDALGTTFKCHLIK